MFVYEPETGIIRRRPGRRNKGPGQRAGYRKDGYREVEVRHRLYREHRLIWLIVTGQWPAELVDHRNGDGEDNCWTNLREATQPMNAQNLRNATKANLTSGLLGVTLHKCGRWQAAISVDGRPRYLGLFADPNVAHATYLEAKRELHKGCTL
ncbi:MAG: HNH endonuclease [Methylibium sp.]|nr:HNH endonuclease [Methylibium sp.]